ncbi:pyridoxal phosphate-dependent transferase [Phakopsora pachyrhizi]|uniref:Pyridoxal phosphate-dependent transferase n=1 Tax=Phakopsora pachyrhizi TaxID=170000 RepID=A0AAV0AHC3_PHAPC|nr:pyridoxal phosphate-dependent transferase [Phakopsora pachyrhizi]
MMVFGIDFDLGLARRIKTVAEPVKSSSSEVPADKFSGIGFASQPNPVSQINYPPSLAPTAGTYRPFSDDSPFSNTNLYDYLLKQGLFEVARLFVTNRADLELAKGPKARISVAANPILNIHKRRQSDGSLEFSSSAIEGWAGKFFLETTFTPYDQEMLMQMIRGIVPVTVPPVTLTVAAPPPLPSWLAFQLINSTCQDDLRNHLSVPSNFEIIFSQGGGLLQFSTVVMNLVNRYQLINRTRPQDPVFADYLRLRCSVNVLTDSRQFSHDLKTFDSIPDQLTWKFGDHHLAFIYYCDNETVNGVEFTEEGILGGSGLPKNYEDVPIVVDMSSKILTRCIPTRLWDRVGVIFEGAQKNMRPSGLTVVVVRKDLMEMGIKTTLARGVGIWEFAEEDGLRLVK